jgi:microcystin-dependent protein
VPGLGQDVGLSVPSSGETCTLGQMILTATRWSPGTPAMGQILQIQDNPALFSLLGTLYGGDGRTTFALPDMRALTPNHMTYMICTSGIFPSPLN